MSTAFFWAPKVDETSTQHLLAARFAKSLELRSRFHAMIPGGAHTYAKGDDQFPEWATPYLVRGEGCRVWDVDGNEFIEFGMGLRSVVLGHAFAPVLEAARRQMQFGANLGRPSPLELDCAERLVNLVPGAEMAKFCKNGSDAQDAAVKLARAVTGRNLVAICGDHPFFSVGDWFIGSTPVAAGIPEVVRNLTLKFRYNDPASLEALFAQYPGQIAAVVLEPEKDQEPQHRFLHQVQTLCRQHGAVFVLDEMICGFRWHNGGGQAFHGIEPDLSTFGKGMGNGFAISALVGKRELMRRGGLDHEAERVFLLSTTHGAETHALAAALAVMDTYQRESVVAHLWWQGKRLADGIREVVRSLELEPYFSISGRPCCLMYGTRDAERKPSQAFRALFLQELLVRGVLAPSFVVSYSHRDADIDLTVDAVNGALRVYRRALDEGVEKFLVGRPVKPVMRTFN